MKKFVSLLVAVMMALALVPSMSLADEAEPIVITAFVAGNPELDYSENYTLKMMEEQTGVRLDVSEYLVTSSDAATQKQLVLASGDYPDIFLTGFTYAEMLNYGVKDGTLVPLDEYLTTRLSEFPTIETLYTARPEYLNMLTAPDGHVYGMNHFSECGHCRAKNKTYVNMDWLEQLGMEVPTTLDEFHDLLTAIKTTDLNGNGEADEIALTSCEATFISYIINAFLPCEVGSGKFTTIKDGVASFGASTEEYRNALRYMKQLFDEGLIDEAAFTQTSEQMSQVVSGEAPMVGVFSVSGGIYQIDMTNEYAYGNYRLMMPLKTADGAQYADNMSIANMNAGASFAMTDACENPDAAMKFMDALMNFDTYMIRVYGLEGEGWQYAEPGQTNVLGGEYRYQFLDTTVGGSVTTDNVIFYGGPWGALMEYRALWSNLWPDDVLYSDSKYFESRIELETEELSPYFIETAPDYFFLTEEETTEYSEILTNVKDYVKLATAQFITGVKNIDSDWDSYLGDLERYNVNRFVELYQKGYDSIYKTAE